tara:strand:+ start:490 stop:1098 length:609 start_codon:yes stop_codon:yes gene_type:complete
LENKSKEDIERLVDTILECGYYWNEEHNQFYHPEIRKGIKTSGLDMFTAESFKETFESSWNNPEWQKETAIRKTCVKLLLLSVPLFLFSLISFLFLNWKISFAGVVVSIGIAILSETIKKRSLKREGLYVDTKKIEWCMTCKNHKKVKDYEEELCLLDEICDADKIPCKIYQETKMVWTDYFDKPKEERTLYPKNCPKWTKK